MGASGLFSQETFTKTLLQHKQPRVKQGLHMKKSLLMTTVLSVFGLSPLVHFEKQEVAETTKKAALACEGDVSSVRGTEPPQFLVLSPENYTVYAADTVTLSLASISLIQHGWWLCDCD